MWKRCPGLGAHVYNPRCKVEESPETLAEGALGTGCALPGSCSSRPAGPRAGAQGRGFTGGTRAAPNPRGLPGGGRCLHVEPGGTGKSDRSGGKRPRLRPRHEDGAWGRAPGFPGPRRAQRDVSALASRAARPPPARDAIARRRRSGEAERGMAAAWRRGRCLALLLRRGARPAGELGRPGRAVTLRCRAAGILRGALAGGGAGPAAPRGRLLPRGPACGAAGCRAFRLPAAALAGERRTPGPVCAHGGDAAPGVLSRSPFPGGRWGPWCRPGAAPGERRLRTPSAGAGRRVLRVVSPSRPLRVRWLCSA